MGRKDFQKGMAAGAKPFEDKFRQVGRQLDDFSEKMNGKINKVVETNEAIIDALDSMQKKQFFKDNTPVDISALNKGGRETLLSLLLTLTETEENVNENQKSFIRSVKRYLNKTDAERKPENYGVLNNGDWTILETIDGIDETKAIAQAVMEFLFLGYGNHEDYLDEYEDLFDNFSLNRKKFAEITGHIDNIYHATGMEGIAENYGFAPEIVIGAPEYGASDGLDEEKIKEKIEVNKGEEKTFANKKVILSNGNINIRQDGKLVFDNCHIVSDETLPNSEGIFAYEACNAAIVFLNCTVEPKSELSWDGFIRTVCTKSIKITFENCIINASEKFISGGIGDNVSIVLKHSLVTVEVPDKFNEWCFQAKTSEIEDCMFEGNGGEVERGFHYSIFSGKCLIKNCKFKNLKPEICSAGSVIQNATFADCFLYPCCKYINCAIDNCLILATYSTDNPVCVFEGVKINGSYGSMWGKSISLKNVDISNSYFVLYSRNSINIENCNFCDWDFNKFKDIQLGECGRNYGDIATIEVDNLCDIKNCRFKNLILREKVLIGTRSSENYAIKINITNCAFENVETASKSVLAKTYEYIEYYGFRGRKSRHTTKNISYEIQDCLGI